MNQRVLFLTRTAVLLALTIVFQTMGRFLTPYLGPNNNFVVGPLVNACLIIASSFVGLWGGAAIAILAPFGAILSGASLPLPFAPFIAAGNFVIVLIFYMLKNKPVLGVIFGSLLKFACLYGSVNLFVRMMKLPAQKASALIFTFSWPQLVTALLGGAIALIVVKALGKSGILRINES